jgi:hypothetical protein
VGMDSQKINQKLVKCSKNNKSLEMKKLLAVFDALMESKTTGEVDSLLGDNGIDKRFQFSIEKYPELRFKISREEIIELKKRNILDKENLIQDVSSLNTVEKLLYALAWKNGDLKKIKHIVAGILTSETDPVGKAIVFNQFGIHLSGKHNEPIIDQHVMRAFAIYHYRENQHEMERFRKMDLVTKEHKTLIKRYKAWLSEELTTELMQSVDYTYHVDKVLFALGKYAKNQ